MPTSWKAFFAALPERTVITDRDLTVDTLGEDVRPEVHRAQATGGRPQRSKSQTRQTGPAPELVDGYRNRLLKYIPAEGLAFYLTLDGIVRSGTSRDQNVEFWALLVVFLVGCVFNWFYLANAAGVFKVGQRIISMGAYLVWIYAVGG